MRNKHYLLLFFSFIVIGLIAQSPPKKPNDSTQVQLASPYHAVNWHLSHLNTHHYEPEVAALALYPDGYTLDQRKEWAIKLYQIYTGGGLYINLKKIPADTTYKDTANRNRFVLWKAHPEIYLEKTGRNWYYSNYTLREIDRIHAEIYPWGAAFLLQFVPKLGNESFLGLYIWQYVGLILLLVCGLILFKTLDILFRILIRRISKTKIGINYMNEVKIVAKPLSMFFVTYFLINVIPILQLPLLLSSALFFLLKIAKPTFLVLTVYNLVDLLARVGTVVADRTQAKLDNQLVPLLRKTLKLVVSVFGVIFILRSIDVDVVTLLAGLSIGGLAIALAAQDSVKNFLGSVTILLDNTFQIGDHIEVDSKNGVVEDVGFRSTRLRTYDGSIITIPNAKLIDTVVINNGHKKFRKFTPKILLSSTASPETIKLFLADIQALLDKNAHTHNQGNQVFVSNLNSKQIEIFVAVLFDETMANETQVRQEVVLGIMDLVKKHGVELQ